MKKELEKFGFLRSVPTFTLSHVALQRPVMAQTGAEERSQQESDVRRCKQETDILKIPTIYPAQCFHFQPLCSESAGRTQQTLQP